MPLWQGARRPAVLSILGAAEVLNLRRAAAVQQTFLPRPRLPWKGTLRRPLFLCHVGVSLISVSAPGGAAPCGQSKITHGAPRLEGILATTTPACSILCPPPHDNRHEHHHRQAAAPDAVQPEGPAHPRGAVSGLV